MKMKWMKITGAGIVLFALFAVIFYAVWMRPHYTVPILMYHYVDGENWGLSVTPENFEKQIKFLSDKKYNVISLDAFVQQKKSGKPFAHNTVVITFDDGRRDNYTHAFPILKKYDMPATIFLITQWMGQSHYLTWPQVREMEQHGVDFGSHTQHHRYIPDLGEEELRREIFGSKKDIEGRLGEPVRHFCYPSGGFTETSKRIIREAGYESASATNRGFDRYNKDIYELNRIKIKNRDADNLLHFRVKLSGYYNFFRRGKSGE